MKTSIERIALKYRDALVCPTAEKATNIEEVLMLQAEVMRLGYMFDKELFDRLSTLSEEKIAKVYRKVVPILQNLKGADKKWKVFYPNFPKQVLKASDAELFYNAVMHYWNFGRWMPVYKNSRRLPKMESVKFTVLKLIEEDETFTIFTDLLSSNISMSESNLEDLEWIIKRNGDDLLPYMPEKIPFKETLCTFLGCCIQNKLIFANAAASNASDVLRVMTYLSGGDISLAENTRFRSWKRAERRMLLSMLESCINEDDIARHEGKWKKAFHGLHVGDYAKKFPKSYAVASKLRNSKIRTFYGYVDSAMRSGNSEKVLSLLGSRPGELARRLDFLLRGNSEYSEQVLDVYQAVASKVDTRVLLQVLGHFRKRAELVSQRVVIPKGMQSKARILNKPLLPLPHVTVNKVVHITSEALREKFGSQDKLGKVWIDPELDKCPVPMAQRSAAETLRMVARGTRLPLGDKNTLRMFVWWVGRDVDLSCVLYDEHFKNRGQISYTNLRLKGINCAHSGDITHAPNGAAEFIDIDMDQASEAGVRYVMMNVLDFSRIKFSGYEECFAGWMTRDHPNSNEIYDAKTVEQKIDLRSDTSLAAPVLFDLQEREAVWLDLNGRINGKCPNNVESNAASIVDLAQSALMLSEKLSLYDLFELHAEARGEQIENKEDADVIFSLDEGITPFDVVKISSDFVA